MSGAEISVNGRVKPAAQGLQRPVHVQPDPDQHPRPVAALDERGGEEVGCGGVVAGGRAAFACHLLRVTGEHQDPAGLDLPDLGHLELAEAEPGLEHGPSSRVQWVSLISTRRTPGDGYAVNTDVRGFSVKASP